jgi:prepilin-type N-terminal cleavage/methylation domain-containing protein
MQTIKSRASKGCRGMTLPEVMVAVGISSIVLAVVAAFSFFSARSFAAIGNYVDLDNTSRKAVDAMTKEIRQTAALSDYQTNALTFLDYDGKPLQYIYDPAEQKLTRVKDAISTVLLSGCDSLEFHIYQRTPQPGTNGFYTATDASQCKLIEMKWRCSRLLLGKSANTETVQTAQVVIRN